MEILQKDGVPIVSFADKQLFYDWLGESHDKLDAFWLRMYKKASGQPTIRWAEAVEVALCFGWIDGVVNKYDDVSYLQRLTPRRKRSVWSKINCATVERLVAEGAMRPAGLAQVEAAKADGRWEAAYDSPANMEMPEDFITLLKDHPKAEAFYATLSRSSRYSIAYNLHNARKPETRERRIAKYLALLEAGQKP